MGVEDILRVLCPLPIGGGFCPCGEAGSDQVSDLSLVVWLPVFAGFLKGIVDMLNGGVPGVGATLVGW